MLDSEMGPELVQAQVEQDLESELVLVLAQLLVPATAREPEQVLVLARVLEPERVELELVLAYERVLVQVWEPVPALGLVSELV